MNRFDFDWVDAFSPAPFGGNGCAVVHGGARLSAETAMAYTRETGLVECTFTGPSEVADIRVRYFLADREIPFAGHPTLATVAAMRDRGMITGASVTLETGAGIVPVTLDGEMIEMTQVAPTYGAELDPSMVAQALRLSPEDIAAPPQVVSTGLPFCITLLGDRGALRAAKLDTGALDHLREVSGDFLEPFLVTLGGETEEGDTFSRLLLPPPLPPEDPFTGSATGAMAAWLWKTGRMEKDSFTAEQGHWMGRPGKARVTRLGPPEALKGIRVAGRAFVLMRGTVDLPR